MLFCILLSSISFFIYGLSYFFSSKIEEEFKRFGLPNIALFVAFAQISGSIGLIFGLMNTTILIYSSAGLCVMMIFACLARLRVKDSFRVSFPAIFYLILNIVIFVHSLSLL